MAPDSEVHPPAANRELVGDLLAGRSGADDEHSAVRELRGMAVAAAVQLDHTGRNRRAQLGNSRTVQIPGRDDHVAGTDAAPVGPDPPTTAIGEHPGDGHPVRTGGPKERA
jgi:hypothetical protein